MSMDDWKHHVRRTLRPLRLAPEREREIIDELSQHLEERYAELRRSGLPDAAARDEVLSELEAPGFLSERLEGIEHAVDLDPVVPGGRGSAGSAALWQDLRYAVRVLRKSPGFSLVAILTLALGIGATTAIFSVVDAVMLRPLPFPNSDRLVRIYESDLKHGRPEFSTSQPNFVDFRAQNHTFERLFASGGATLNLTTPEGAEPLVARRVTADFLPGLGAAPAIGRNFSPDEDRPGAPARVAIVTSGFWQRRMGGDARLADRTLTLNGASYSVIGVLPRSFVWTVPNLDVLVPLGADPGQPRGDHQLAAYGLLKAGVGLDQANADLHTIAAQLSVQYPESNEGWSVRLRTFYDWLVPADTRQTLAVLFTAVGFVLLIAAGNVANLLLARANVRQKEMSIRVALGAGRRRILSQLLVESSMLALVGGAVGCGVAVAATRVLKALAPGIVPRLDEVAVDARVLGFAFALSLATGILFGLAPALQASRPNTGEALKDAGRSGSGGMRRQRTRDALVVVEVALSVALLIGAGLLVRSMWALQHVNPGFDTRSLLTLQLNLSARPGPFFFETVRRVSALPGVVAASTASMVPMGGGNTSIQIVVEGRPVDAAGIVPSADWRAIGPGYFKTLGVGLRGRDFEDRDARDTRSAIISEEMARRYWPGVDPIGRDFFWFSTSGPKLTVIGVAGDVRNLSLDTAPAPIIYRSAASLPVNPTFLVVRTDPNPAALTSAIRDVVRAVNPNVPVSNVRTGDEILAASIGPRRFNMVLLGSFAAVALILACIGLFGVMSYLVSQRTHDIGVRLALGALPRDIFRDVVGRGMLLAVAGAAAGVGCAAWVTRSLETLLFQVRPIDPVTFVAVALVLLAVALVACVIPARRATRVDPVIALRYE
jgi:putative ABC transport system permease protein